MATPEEVTEFRMMIGEPTQDTFTDAYLSGIIDSADSLDHSALAIWTSKAAMYAGMVDTAESGSSRRLSQLMDNALKMVAFYKERTAPAQPEPDMTGYSYTIPIARV